MFEPCMKIKSIMDKFGYPWFIAGEWAIDLFLNDETQVHNDIEIGIYRKNQMQLFRFFDKQRKYYIDNRNTFGKHEKHEWNKEYLQFPIHEIYIRYEESEIEVLLNEKDSDNWIYGKNSKVRLDEKKVIQFTENEIPYLCPEIILFQKIEDIGIKAIDNTSKIIIKMNDSQRNWLMENIKDRIIRENVRNLTIAST
jgi:hypothetical protein